MLWRPGPPGACRCAALPACSSARSSCRRPGTREACRTLALPTQSRRPSRTSIPIQRGGRRRWPGIWSSSTAIPIWRPRSSAGRCDSKRESRMERRRRRKYPASRARSVHRSRRSATASSGWRSDPWPRWLPPRRNRFSAWAAWSYSSSSTTPFTCRCGCGSSPRATCARRASSRRSRAHTCRAVPRS